MAIEDAAELEHLYRTTVANGTESAFEEVIRECAREHPQAILFTAWLHRFEVPDLSSGRETKHPVTGQNDIQHWKVAVVASAVMGITSALLTQGKPPIPLPSEADPLFWIGFFPLTIISILTYLSLVERSRKRSYRYAVAVVALLSIAVYSGLTAWNRIDDIATLISLHLPLVSFGTLGAALVVGRPRLAMQCHAFLVKALETTVTGGIYLAAGLILLGLTAGIFEVLSVGLPMAYIQIASAWGIGAIPVLAVASAYDPKLAPLAQDWKPGLTRVLRILAQLILPLALGVLIVYDFWFLPRYFRRGFQEREVLMIYNMTILAILALVTLVVSNPTKKRSTHRQSIISRYGVISLGGLTILLNFYALAAITGRIVQFGLTPNRYAVLGWNIVTLTTFVLVGISLWKQGLDRWDSIVRRSIGYASILGVVWTSWVLIGLPIIFS